MCVVTEEKNPELYEVLFEEGTSGESIGDMLHRKLSAKEMFEELGYEEYKTDERLYWSIPNEYELGGVEPYVVFDLIYQNWNTNIVEIEREKDLIQAINKQVEELGWNK